MGWEVPKSEFKWPNVSSAENMDKSEQPKNDQNHRITEWLELEGALNHLVLIPLPWAGTPEELQRAGCLSAEREASLCDGTIFLCCF